MFQAKLYSKFNKLKHMKKIISSFLIATMGGVVSIGAYKVLESDQAQEAPQRSSDTQLVNLISSQPENAIDYVTAAEMTVNGVVHVKTDP